MKNGFLNPTGKKKDEDDKTELDLKDGQYRNADGHLEMLEKDDRALEYPKLLKKYGKEKHGKLTFK